MEIFIGLIFAIIVLICIAAASNSKHERAVLNTLTERTKAVLPDIAAKLIRPWAWKGDVDGLYYRIRAIGIEASGYYLTETGEVMDEVREHLKAGRVHGLVSNPRGGQQYFRLEVQDSNTLKWYTIHD